MSLVVIGKHAFMANDDYDILNIYSSVQCELRFCFVCLFFSSIFPGDYISFQRLDWPMSTNEAESHV